MLCRRARRCRRCISGSTGAAAGSRGTGSSGRPSRIAAASTTARRSTTSSRPVRRRTARTGRCKRGSHICRIAVSRRGCRNRRSGSSTSRIGAARSANLEVYTDWAFAGQAHDLFGRLTYGGNPVYGFGTGRDGGPSDRYGRHLYIDTFNSAYGEGWKRETSTAFRTGSGAFCYSFWPTTDKTLPGYPNNPRPAGNGQRYRITVEGPGVTPIVHVGGRRLTQFRRVESGGRRVRAQPGHALHAVPRERQVLSVAAVAQNRAVAPRWRS